MSLDEIRLTIKNVQEDSCHYEKNHFVACIEFLLKETESLQVAYDSVAMGLEEERK